MYKLSLPKKVSLQSIQPSKKSNFWKTQSSPPYEYGQILKEYRPNRENGQGIYGSLYKLSLPESQFEKHTTLGFPLKKSYLLMIELKTVLQQ